MKIEEYEAYLKRVQEMSEEYKKNYASELETAFSTRADAYLGDGCLPALGNLESKCTNATVEVIFHSEEHYFIMIDNINVQLLAKKFLEKEEQWKHTVQISEYGIDEQILALQQLVSNPWIEIPEKLEI